VVNTAHFKKEKASMWGTLRPSVTPLDLTALGRSFIWQLAHLPHCQSAIFRAGLWSANHAISFDLSACYMPLLG